MGAFENAGRFILLLSVPLALSYAETGPTRTPARSAQGVGAASSSVQASVFPRIVCGNGWDTTATLFNTDSSPVTFQQFFFGKDGKLTTFTVRSSADAQTTLTTSAVQGVLESGSSLSMGLCNSSNAVREGWSYLNYTGTAGAIDGYTTITHKALSGARSETVIPLKSSQDYSVLMPFDNTQGFRSQLTLVNPASNLAAEVRLTYRTPQGKTLFFDVVTIGADQQTTLVLPDMYPDLANKTGSVLIEGNIDRLSVSGLRYNDLDGTISALPTMHPSAQ